MKTSPYERTLAFCRRFRLAAPIVLAPMAGLQTLDLSVAVARSGGMGALGAAALSPEDILQWSERFRRRNPGPFQINLWTPDPPPLRDRVDEERMRLFLKDWGPTPSDQAGDVRSPDFGAQLDAALTARPEVFSTIMGLLTRDQAAEFRRAGVSWWATVTTVGEALLAESAGAEVLIVQGAEAGGHRGVFCSERAESTSSGLMALIPAVADAVPLPLVAAGGVADGRGVAAALVLGASAVQIGTGFLRAREARIPRAWSEALATAYPEDTRLTRGFSGRLGRSLATAYVQALEDPSAPRPAPYPVQRALTREMREAAAAANSLDGLQAWAGQGARLARPDAAGEIVNTIWRGAKGLLGVRPEGA